MDNKPLNNHYQPAKRDCGGECSRAVCKVGPALWYNSSTTWFYCQSCALKINSMNPGQLCHRVESRRMREMSIEFKAIGQRMEIAGFEGYPVAVQDYNKLAKGEANNAVWAAVRCDEKKPPQWAVKAQYAMMAMHEAYRFYGQGKSQNGHVSRWFTSAMEELNKAFAMRADEIEAMEKKFNGEDLV